VSIERPLAEAPDRRRAQEDSAWRNAPYKNHFDARRKLGDGFAAAGYAVINQGEQP
jgi:hypothetical protein